MPTVSKFAVVVLFCFVCLWTYLLDASGVLGKGMSRCTGALFFAVYRGKVSEGLDFTDNNARAVITVSIVSLEQKAGPGCI